MSKLQEEIAYKSQFFKPERVQRMQDVLDQRTRHITFVLEDVAKSQNANAVLRSADAFGFQDVHIIENEHVFHHYPLVTKKSDEWLTLNRHNALDHNTESCLTQLKSDGYRLVGTAFKNPTYPLHELPVTNQKLAIVMGTEASGLSATALELMDDIVYIPMYGFAQSFNLSVTTAMIMQHVRPELDKLSCNWKLSQAEKEEILVEWLSQRIPNKA